MFFILKRLKEVEASPVYTAKYGMIAALQKKYIAEESTKKSVSSHYLSRPDDAEAEAINRMLYIAGCGRHTHY